MQGSCFSWGLVGFCVPQDPCSKSITIVERPPSDIRADSLFCLDCHQRMTQSHDYSESLCFKRGIGFDYGIVKEVKLQIICDYIL